jgi:murein DD-endopeptidase MepM/ murein hydrolase activator NlpD
VVLALAVSLLFVPCLFEAPVDGPVVAAFAPDGLYGGHWGIDLAAPEGTSVGASAAGVVTFSGEVAGRSSVTIHHGGSVRTSYSYLGSRSVAQGAVVERGQVIGTSGVDHGVPAVHFSVRVGDRYLDPMAAMCPSLDPGPGLRLAPTA